MAGWRQQLSLSLETCTVVRHFRPRVFHVLRALGTRSRRARFVSPSCISRGGRRSVLEIEYAWIVAGEEEEEDGDDDDESARLRI